MKNLLMLIALSVFTFQLQAQVTFTLASSPGVGINPTYPTSADVNGDGKLDLIVADNGATTIQVLTNNGSGGFVLSSSPTISAGASTVATSDVNGDGKVDIICGNFQPGASTVTVLTNNGSGGFVLAAGMSAGAGSRPMSVAAADVNGDGKMDVISANYGTSTLTAFTNNGSGGWVLSGTYAVGSGPQTVTTADVNGDGMVDLISANSGGNTLTVLTNSGNGGFVSSGTYPVGSSPAIVIAADVNGDGKVDLIGMNLGGNSLSVLTNGGSGGFVLRGTYAVGVTPDGMAAADVNGDGKVDFITADNFDNTLSVMTNDGTGALGLAVTLSVGRNPGQVTAADVNGDGRVDLICTDYDDNTLSVLFNTTIFPVTPPTITTQPANQTVFAGDAAVFTVGAYGSQPMSYQWSMNGTNLVNATNATLTLTNVQAADGGAYAAFISNTYGQTNSASATLTVLSVPPTIASQPTNQTVQAGSTANFAVTATGPKPFSYQWNYNGTNIAGATNATLTLTNVQTSQAGNYAVSVTNTYGSTLSSNAALSVLATLDHFVWDPIASLQAVNQPFNVSITAKNIFGATVTNFNGTANMSVITSGSGTNSTIVITEIDPNTPDFIEFMNVSANSVNMSGWLITIYDSTAYPSPLINFVVPTNTIVPPSGVFRVTEFGTAPGTYPNFFIGVNINWTASVSTPIAVLVRNASGSVVDFACVGAAVSTAISNPVTVSTNQWSGGSIPGNSNGANNYQRVGNKDNNNNSDWVTASASPGLTNAGLTSPFIGGSSGISILPASTGTFNLGVWNGNITITQLATNILLFANDGSGHTGFSKPFNVITAPSITAQPQSQTSLVGGSATFNVTASGAAPLSYQWSWNGTNILGATNSTLTLANIQLAQAGNYSVLVANPVGATNSSAATLTVGLPPVINQQPQNLTVLSYNSASFTVTASGTGPLNFHWRKNGTNLVDGGNISGSTTTNLSLANVSLNDAGNYDVVVNNAFATTNSAIAVLTVRQTMLALVSTNAMSGDTVVVPVLMNALGVENAFQASIGYDPTKLALKNVQLGKDAAAGAYLQEVDSQTNNGYVGFVILLNADSTQSAGTNAEVVDLVFTALPVTNNTTVNLTFGDNPIGRGVSDQNGVSFPAIYQNGTVALTPAEYAADVYPRPTGDHQVGLSDWVEVGRMVAALDTPSNSDELLRADCAPRNAPDGVLTVADWVQAGRYELGLDPLTLVTPLLNPSLRMKPMGGQQTTRLLLIGSVTAQRGQTVSVPVQLVSSTNENAVGMTVGYDASRLKFLNATLGSAIIGGRINVNTNQLAGEVGVALAMSPGLGLAAGTNQIAMLQFTAGTNASGAVILSLDDSVVKLQVADKLANVLTFSSANGAVVLPPQPTMTTTITGANLQLTWPLSTGTFQVQSADNPAGPWSNAALTVITNGGNATVTVTATNQQQYFRLVGQ
jgi:hypothetical protein